MENKETDFDDNWIEEFEDDDKKYDVFNEEENDSIKINILYVNKRNEIEKINEKSIILNKPNKINKEELIKLIKENEKPNKIKYKLLSILVYNLSLRNEEIKNFLRNSDEYDFLTSLTHIDDYGFKSSINCLQDINTLYVLFNEENIDIKNRATTKRVRFNLANGKTRRKKV
jgi:hypothetical protein